MHPVKSSMLTHLGFDVESFTLFARYSSGALFAYEDVSPEEYERIINAESIGKAFNVMQRIKRGTKLEDARMVPDMEKSGAAPTLERSKRFEQQTAHEIIEAVAKVLPEPIVDELPTPIVEPTHFDTQEKAVETAVAVAAKFAAIEVNNAVQRVQAGELLVEIERERKARLEWFKPIKDAAYQTHKGICDREKDALAPLVLARQQIEARMSTYDREEMRVRREQEQRLQKEQEDKEHERAKREAEELRLRQAQELETQGRHEEVTQVLNEPIVPTKRPQPAVILPTQAPAVKGVSSRKTFSFRIDDSALLPRKYLMPDESAIRKVVNALGLDAEIPGVSVSDGSGYRVNTKHAAPKGGK